MSPLSDAVRRQALHFTTLPLMPGWRLVRGDHATVALHPFPFGQPIEPHDELEQAQIPEAIAETRRILTENGRSEAVWFAGPDHPWLAAALASHGLKNEDSPGFEAVESAMALLSAPAGAGGENLKITIVESFEDFAACQRVQLTAFEIDEQGRAEMEAEMESHFADYATENNPFRLWLARSDGQVAGTAGAIFADAGINLFGGAVLPEARGKGVYRALVSTRWEAAVERGTPALTVQAGRMSRPVLESLGFELIGEMLTYVDKFGASTI